MTDDLANIDLNQLSVAEQILLVEDLWDRIALKQGEHSLSESQLADLDRRLDDFEQTGDAGDSWEAVKARILERRKCSPYDQRFVSSPGAKNLER